MTDQTVKNRYYSLTLNGDLSKTVYVHTFHSQVPETLINLDIDPDVIFSFDTHLDLQIGIKEHLDAIPESYRTIALRVNAHTDIRRAFGEIPFFVSLEERDYLENCPLFLIVPQIGFETDIASLRQNVESTHEGGEFYSSLINVTKKTFNAQKKIRKSFLKGMFDINIFESPPKNLGKFIDKINPRHESIWDIDVDYISDFQDECYTPLKNAERTLLGNLNRVLKAIRKYSPEVITISEAKNSVINRSSSKFFKFIKKIKKLDYEVNYKNVIDKTDKELFNLMEKYKKYVLNIKEPLQIKYSYEPSNVFNKELIEATKRYFNALE